MMTPEGVNLSRKAEFSSFRLFIGIIVCLIDHIYKQIPESSTKVSFTIIM